MPKEKGEHVEFQRSFFDEHVDMFKRPIPEDVVERSREIVRALVSKEELRILDVGTGIGAFLNYYLEAGVPPSQILGCDLSTEMLSEARKRFPEVSFWQGDILHLPAEFGPFDLVVFNACFGNIFDQLSVLKKSSSLLRKQGRIAISHPMGNEFVQQLKNDYPDLVITLLPDRKTLDEWALKLGMICSTFRDEPELYLAILSLD